MNTFSSANGTCFHADTTSPASVTKNQLHPDYNTLTVVDIQKGGSCVLAVQPFKSTQPLGADSRYPGIDRTRI
jgi:hypothetical protein